MMHAFGPMIDALLGVIVLMILIACVIVGGVFTIVLIMKFIDLFFDSIRRK